MSFALIENLLRSVSFRVSLVHAALLALAFLAAGLATALVSRDVAEGELRARILVEADGVAQAIAHGGLASGVVAVDARAERPVSLEYRLVDPNQRLVAGDLPIADAPIGWTHVQLPATAQGAEGRERLLVFTQRMPDGSLLTLGDDISRLEGVRDHVLLSLAWIDGSALALGLVAGLFFTRRALRRMDAMTKTVAAFARNDLAARAPARDNGGDDIDAHARAVNSMLDQIARLVADLKRVSADIAHDLRTPLAQALQRLERARAESEPAAREAALVAAEAKIKESLRLFEAMLRLAEIDAGAARARFVAVNLSEVVERMADAYRLDLESSSRRLTVEAPERCVVNGDEELIAQALANLIENAMRHTPSGATIRIGTEKDDRHCVVFVADDGPGLPEAQRTEALLPFTRIESSRHGAGFGLGLPIVAAVARLHGAKLALEDARPGLLVRLTFSAMQGI